MGRLSGEQSLFDDLPLEANGGVTGLKKAEGKNLEEDDVYEELKELVGPEAADRLVERYLGSNLYLPKRIYIKRKYKKIREEFKNGASYREIGFKYGYSERYVRVIVHGKGRKNG